MKRKTEKQLDKIIKDYISKCIEDKKLPTKNGICLSLDITRETYRQWKKNSDTLKKAEQIIEEYWVLALPNKKYNVAGIIFYLKNAFAWRDRSETDITSGGQPVKISFDSSFNKNETPS